VYRSEPFCVPTWGGLRCFGSKFVLVDSQKQTANLVNAESAPYAFLNPYHGYEFALPYAAGDRACVTALNVGSGGDASLGCVTLVWVT
jgi:hypothetical protein